MYLRLAVLALAIITLDVPSSSGADDSGIHIEGHIDDTTDHPNDLEARLRECDKTPRDCKKLNKKALSDAAEVIAIGRNQCIQKVSISFNLKGGDLQELRDPVALKELVRQSCDAAPTLINCIQDADEKARTCVCEVEMEFFKQLPDTTWEMLKRDCDQGKLEEILSNGGYEFWKQHADDSERCLVNLAEGLPSKGGENTFDSGTLPRLLADRYTRLRSFKECLGKIGKGKDASLQYVLSLMDQVLKDMRCVKDNKNSLVPCSSVVRGGSQATSPSVQYVVSVVVFWVSLAWVRQA